MRTQRILLWPLFLVALNTSLVTFVTWLTLGRSALGSAEQTGISTLVFVVVGGSMLTFVLGRMRRHRLAADRLKPGSTSSDRLVNGNGLPPTGNQMPRSTT